MAKYSLVFHYLLYIFYYKMKIHAFMIKPQPRNIIQKTEE